MADARISFHFQHPTFRLRQRRLVRQWLHACAEAESQTIGSLRYMFCTDAYIHEANVQFLQHDYLTDILTFPDQSSQGIAGDILISVDRVRDNAQTHDASVRNELHRVIAHGALHLLGYDDTDAENQQAMRQQEDAWLNRRTF